MIGEQIQRMRNERKLSLRSLSALIKERGFVDGLSYSVIQRIESGDRKKVATYELAELAEVLGTSIATLIGSRDRSASLSLAARVSEHPSDGTVGAVKARAVEVLEAQDLLGRLVEPLSTRPRPNIPNIPVSRAGGKLLAEIMREELQLGIAPIADLAVLIEDAFGALVFKEPLPTGTSGFCAIDDDAAVILVNSEDTAGRQNFTLAHEFCHLILRDVDTVEVLRQSGGAKSNNEGRADDFAAHFLAPDEALVSTLENSRADAIDVVRLAHRFSMSLEAMTIRLRNLRLLAPDVDDELRVGHRRLAELGGLMGDYRAEEQARGTRTPSGRLTDLVLSAFDRGQVGIGLVAAVTGERDLDRLRSVLRGSESVHVPDFEDATRLA